MTAEQERWPGGPITELGRRIDELSAKLRLGRDRLENATVSLVLTGEILPYEIAVEYLTKIRTDLRWVAALKQANWSYEAILYIWDKKEEMERERRDRAQP